MCVCMCVCVCNACCVNIVSLKVNKDVDWITMK